MTEELETEISLISHIPAAPLVDGSQVFAAVIEIPPGSEGSKPHRHAGPVFGYMLEGEMLFELEGEEPRAIKAGEAFWEPGGDTVHWQAANLQPDAPTRFVVHMMCPPGGDLFAFLTPEEMKERDHLRHPNATAWR